MEIRIEVINGYMQQKAASNKLPQKILSANQIALILSLLDQKLYGLEKTSNAADENDIMMSIFILCTFLSYSGLPANLAYWIGNIFWNGIDLLSVRRGTKEWLDSHKDWPTRGAAGFNCLTVVVMAAATSWSATATAGVAPMNVVVGGSVITGAAVAAGAFSFSLTMLAGAIQSGVAMQRARKRSTYSGLFNEKKRLIDEKIVKKNKLTADIEKLKSKTSKVPIITENQAPQENKKLQILEKRLAKIEKDIETLNSMDENMAHHFSDNQQQPAKPETAEKVLAVDLMLAEQKNIANTKKLDAIACSLACVGSGCAAAAIIFPPAAPLLGIAAGIFLVAAASIKLYQLAEKHTLEKAINQTTRNEREQVFLATAKKLKNDEGNGEFEKVQEKLLNDYCERRKLSKEAFTSTDNRDKAIDLQCKHQYAEENKTWGGFLSHQCKRVEIVKSRFFTAKRPKAQGSAQTVPAT